MDYILLNKKYINAVTYLCYFKNKHRQKGVLKITGFLIHDKFKIDKTTFLFVVITHTKLF